MLKTLVKNQRISADIHALECILLFALSNWNTEVYKVRCLDLTISVDEKRTRVINRIDLQ